MVKRSGTGEDNGGEAGTRLSLADANRATKRRLE